MRKIVASEFISLDGVIEAPENWHFPYLSEDMQADVNAQVHAGDIALYGRATYEEFARFWPQQTQNEFGIADKINTVPKYVVSTTLKQATWQNTTVIGENVVEAIARLKQQGDDIIGLTGNATLAQSLTRAGLVDEFRLWVHPVVVGKGKRLFADGMQEKLHLDKSKTYSSGVVQLIFQPANM